MCTDMPEPLTMIESVAALIEGDNVDTDQIIPSREIKSAARTGLSEGLFSNQRYLSKEKRSPNPDFTLNIPPFTKARILIGGKNFGCGSSREHAVWALHEFGIRCLIAESFGEIFHVNCINNGIAPITLSALEIQYIYNALKEYPHSMLQIDVPRQLIEVKAKTHHTMSFSFSPIEHKRLISGLDLIGLTQEHQQSINTFISKDMCSRTWAYPIQKEST